MAVSLAERILSAQDLAEETLEVPEWGVTLLVRGMTGAQRSAFYRASGGNVAGNGGPPQVNVDGSMAFILEACVYDPETGGAVFTPEQAAAALRKSGAVIDRVTTLALKLSGLAPEAAGEALGK